jgi:hypothetical protein
MASSPDAMLIHQLLLYSSIRLSISTRTWRNLWFLPLPRTAFVVVDELKKIDAKLSTTMGGNLRGRLEGKEKGGADFYLYAVQPGMLSADIPGCAGLFRR